MNLRKMDAFLGQINIQFDTIAHTYELRQIIQANKMDTINLIHMYVDRQVLRYYQTDIVLIFLYHLYM